MLIRYAAPLAFVMAALTGGSASAAESKLESFIAEPMPAGVQVVGTDMDGPVFANAAGHTLYVWGGGRYGGGGGGGADQRDKSKCEDTNDKEASTGNMAPWPEGLEMPDLATRLPCAQVWPPLYAADDAKPVGKWTIITRTSGRKQWAYDHSAVYTSVLDQRPGDVNGGGHLHAQGASGSMRTPLSPRADLPAQFAIESMPTGRLLTLETGFSVYTYDKDSANKSNCDQACAETWKPVLAAVTAPQAHGDWGTTERSPGVYQWTYRKKPLYSLDSDRQKRSFHGADVAGWRNVYTTPAPAFPKGFQVLDNPGGSVLADAHGKTIYIFNCIEDSTDQQSCDHPSTTQAYRLAVCGRFDPKLCNEQFPYVIADKDAKSISQIWGVKDIDPMTGRFVAAGTPGSLHVWTFRDRPLYTFYHDTLPGEVRANAWGEGNGWRNGFHAFWTREEFRRQF